MTIGEKIYELRKLKGLSQEELAEKLNVSRQSVSLWETNQTVPQIDYLMELSKIFNVSLDELCGNGNIEKTEQPSETVIEPIYETTFEFTKDKISEIIIAVQRFPRIVLLISTNLMFICFMIIFKGMFPAVLFFDILTNIILVTYFLRTNKNTIKELTELNTQSLISFYEHNFIINSKSTRREARYDVLYTDITNLYITDNLVIVYFNKRYVAVDKNSLGEFSDVIMNKLTSNAKKVINSSTVNSKSIKTCSIILFILSIVSIFLGAIIMSILSSTGKYSFCSNSYVFYSWVFYIVAVLPLGSLVFGLIFNRRHKCKKNIIIGIIMTTLLCFYGSFCFIFKPLYNFDTSYVNTLTASTSINFPKECLLIQEMPSPTYSTYIKFTNEFEINTFKNNELVLPIWNDISSLGVQNNTYLETYVKSLEEGYDKYCIYDLDTPIVNEFLNYSYDKIVLCYNSEDNVLHVYHVFSAE